MVDARDIVQQLSAQLDAGRQQLLQLDSQLSELAERVDDLERVLAARRMQADECRILSALHGQIAALRETAKHRSDEHFDRMAEFVEALSFEMTRVVGLANLGELSASVAHEIRNPLCGMLLSVEVLETKMDPDDSRTVLLENLHREAEKMEKVVNNLLHFARQYQPRRVSCRMEDVVRHTLESVSRHVEKRGTKVSIRLSSDSDETHIDPDMVHQVFRNILLNAMDACEDGASLDIEIRREGEPAWVSTVFTDTGVGMDAARRERIFDPFFTSKHAGVGLGLSVSRKIVEAHGGRIDVESEPGKGSTFTVVLPGCEECVQEGDQT